MGYLLWEIEENWPRYDGAVLYQSISSRLWGIVWSIGIIWCYECSYAGKCTYFKICYALLICTALSGGHKKKCKYGEIKLCGKKRKKIDSRLSSSTIESTVMFPNDVNASRPHQLHQLQLAYPNSNIHGQQGAHLGPTGPRWAPCLPHEPCYLSTEVWWVVAYVHVYLSTMVSHSYDYYLKTLKLTTITPEVANYFHILSRSFGYHKVLLTTNTFYTLEFRTWCVVMYWNSRQGSFQLTSNN